MPVRLIAPKLNGLRLQHLFAQWESWGETGRGGKSHLSHRLLCLRLGNHTASLLPCSVYRRGNRLWKEKSQRLERYKELLWGHARSQAQVHYCYSILILTRNLCHRYWYYNHLHLDAETTEQGRCMVPKHSVGRSHNGWIQMLMWIILNSFFHCTWKSRKER